MHSRQNCKELLRASDISLKFKVSSFALQSWREIAAAPLSFITGYSNSIEVVAVNSVSLTVFEGDRVGIIGKNGSGKTSLCRCLADIYRPQSGTIARFGKIIPIFRSLGLMQEELTGRENAFLLSLLLTGSRKSARAIMKEAIIFSEVKEFADVAVRFYSDGMKARLLLSIVTSVNAEILILDEALSSADRLFSSKLSERIDKVLSEASAVILVSHNEEEIRRYCTSAIVFQEGKIAFQGAVDLAIKFYQESMV